MQGKLLLVVFAVGVVMAVAYLRTLGPRCGDDRCSDSEYCIKSGERAAATYVCEELHEECGFWPTCECLELPNAYECRGGFWGHLTVDVPAP